MMANDVRVGSSDSSKWLQTSANNKCVSASTAIKTLSLDRRAAPFLNRYRSPDASQKSSTLAPTVHKIDPSYLDGNDNLAMTSRTGNDHNVTLSPTDTNIDTTESRDSFLHNSTSRLKDSLKEARASFLAKSCGLDTFELNSYQNICTKWESKIQQEGASVDVQKCSKQLRKDEATRRNPARKVSFRVRSSIPSTRRTVGISMTTLSPNRVAQLTSKFNQMVHENNTILEEPRIARAVKRVNSIKGSKPDGDVGVKRKSSVRLRTEELHKELKRTLECEKLKPVVKKKPSVKKDATNKMCVRAKIGFLEEPKSILKNVEEIRCADTDTLRKKPSVKRRPSFKTRNCGGTVRAAIQIFEQKDGIKPDQISVRCSSVDKVPKPKVPEKNINVVKTKQLVYKNGLPKLRDLSKNEIKLILKSDESKTETLVQNEHENECVPEPINFPDLVESTDVTDQKICEAINEAIVKTNEEDLKPIPKIKPNNSFLWRSKSKESLRLTFTTYEFADPFVATTAKDENLYDYVESSKTTHAPEQDYYNVRSRTRENGIDVAPVANSDGQKDYKAMFATADAIVQKFKEDITSTIIKKQPQEEEDDYEPLTPTDLPDLVRTRSKRTCTDTQLPLPPEIPNDGTSSIHNYEYCTNSKYEDLDQHSDGYEYCKGDEESLYEQLPPRKDIPVPQRRTLPNGSAEPLPPKPDDYLEDATSNIYYSVKNDIPMSESNCYESIYTVDRAQPETTNCPGNSIFYDFEGSGPSEITGGDKDNNCYESIYIRRRHDDQNSNSGSNRDSIISCDQQSNSLYGGRSITGWGANSDIGAPYCKTGSELSSSDRSDDWVDISEPESPVDGNRAHPGWVIVRERSKFRRTAGWSHKVRDQWEKSPRKRPVEMEGDSDSDHHYESLYTDQISPIDDDYDSFDSDTDSDNINQNDSGVDVSLQKLPDPPSTGQNYRLTKLAATAGKHMQRLRRNWSLTKNDITKSLSRMTKKKSVTDLNPNHAPLTLHVKQPMKPPNQPPPVPPRPPKPLTDYENAQLPLESVIRRHPTPPKTLDLVTYQNMAFASKTSKSKKGESADTNECYENTPFQSTPSPVTDNPEKDNKKDRRKYWSLTHKFRRSLSMSSTQPLVDMQNETNLLPKPKSTFYLTNTVDVDTGQIETSPQVVNNESLPEMMPKTKPAVGQLRPTSPPPAPPQLNSSPLSQKSIKKEKQRATSWYAECGVFKGDKMSPIPKPERGSTCWYAAVGLYQNNGNGSSSSTGVSSSAENSGNSFSSSSTMPCMADTNAETDRNIHSGSINSDEGFKSSTLTNCDLNSSEYYYNLKNEQNTENSTNELMKRDIATPGIENYSDEMQKRLMDEPLYQFYTAAVIECGMRELRSDSSWDDDESDGYEQIGDRINRSTDNNSPLRPTAMQLITPFMSGQARTLWCEVPEVIESAILSTLSSHQKKLQEAKFEMITSEASYLNSLNVLCNHFISVLDNRQFLDKEESQILFGNVDAVKNCSEQLLEDLESCWQNNILLRGICEVIQRHAENNFSVYVTYCENQIYLDRTLRKLKERKGPFFEALTELESSSTCQSLPLHSFLMLPMQRVTRLPLLADAILKRLNPGDEEYETCQIALATLNHVVKQCNEGARRSQRQEEFERTWKLFDFPRDVPEPMLDPGAERWLERSGELIQLISRGDETKLTFGKKFIKSPLNLYLFTDLLIVAKRKTEDCFTVIHHCPRSFIEVNSGETLNQLPVKDAAGKHLLFVTLLENHEKRTIEMLLSCACESDRQRWYEALSSPVSTDPDETLYERWDCPQVAALHMYIPQQPDELPLDAGDIVNVTRKMADGWYQGERLRDGLVGWFPGNHVTEVASAHVRARNLKQRYRLLALSGNYLESQKKVK